MHSRDQTQILRVYTPSAERSDLRGSQGLHRGLRGATDLQRLGCVSTEMVRADHRPSLRPSPSHTSADISQHAALSEQCKSHIHVNAAAGAHVATCRSVVVVVAVLLFGVCLPPQAPNLLPLVHEEKAGYFLLIPR